jgi:hypothetical protein
MSGILAACIFVAILIAAVGAAAKSGLDLAKGKADTAFWGALKMFVLLFILTGIFGWCAIYESGFAGGLNNLIHGNFALFFWIPVAGQTIALPVLILADRKRRRDRN